MLPQIPTYENRPSTALLRRGRSCRGDRILIRNPQKPTGQGRSKLVSFMRFARPRARRVLTGPGTPRLLSVLACVCSLATLCAFSARSSAQDVTRRLILKDGSYQVVTKYEVKGDRVRYYSAEREEWEELPNSLIDWPATEKFEKDQAAMASSPEAVELDKEAEHDREMEETQLPEVAPGLRLPEPSGVFLLETFEGQPQLLELRQSEGDVDQKAKGNIFRDAITPLAGLKQVIELEGTHAATQSHVDVPSIYINIDDNPDESAPAQSEKTSSPSSVRPQQPDQPQQPQQPEQAAVPFDRFRIVKTEIKNGKRIMGDLKRSPTGKISEDQHFVKTTIDRINGGWFKVTPSEPLAPGEYALIEMAENHAINLEVWDFGVNPKAPANPNGWKPEAKSSPAPAKKN
jgi:hypothetical protein